MDVFRCVCVCVRGGGSTNLMIFFIFQFRSVLCLKYSFSFSALRSRNTNIFSFKTKPKATLRQFSYPVTFFVYDFPDGIFVKRNVSLKKKSTNQISGDFPIAKKS